MRAVCLRLFSAALLFAVGACGEGGPPQTAQDAGESRRVVPPPAAGAKGRPAPATLTPVGAAPSHAAGDGRAARLLEATDLDHRWFARLQGSPPDQVQAGDLLGGQSEQAWESLGYVRQADGNYLQAANTLETVGPQGLVPTFSPLMPSVDAVALISIDRDNGEVPYIYSTLRSVFSVFPPETQVNVLVGDANVDYVAMDVLRQELGDGWARRVHVWATDRATHDFIHARFWPQRRGGWNYARALRSYAGERGLILMEDDVRWAPGAVDDMRELLGASPLATTFYNFDCYAPAGTDPLQVAPTVLFPVSIRARKFVCTQGMYFRAELANRLGEHIHRRVHERVWDFVMELFFADLDMEVGFTVPSLVQHMGVHSAGVTPYFHTTACFAGDRLPSARE